MNIVVISEYATRELYVIEQIQKRYPSTIVVQPSYNGESSKGKKASPKKRFQQFTNRITWKLHRELWDRKIFPQKKLPDVSNKIFIPSSELNEPAGIKAIRELTPDILITCRAPLLKPGLIQIPTIAAVNIHYGIAPHYRGNDTLFWPLFFEDYKNLGGSLHHLTEGIDTGNIIAEVYPGLKPTDGEIALDIKTTQLLAKAMLLFLEAAEHSNADLTGKVQSIAGRNFNSKDRTLSMSIKYLVKRMLGLSRPPHRSEKIVTYFF
ncbi:MAG: formyltransferase family protein [Balneolaceae bacterium]